MGVHHKSIPALILLALLITGLCFMGVGCGESDPVEKITETVENVDQQANSAAREANLRIIDAAIQTYYYAEGKMPSTINDLIPQYLKKIPTDPGGGTYSIVVQGEEAKAAVR